MDHPQMCAVSYATMTFCSCDLDLDPMTLIYECDLDFWKMYKHTKNEVSRSELSKVTVSTGQTDRQTDETGHIISRIRG